MEDIREVLESTNVRIRYSRYPEHYNNYDFVITGTKSEVEALFNAMYGDKGWVEQESFNYIDKIDEDNLEDPEDLDIDYLGEYFQLEKAS